MWTSLACSPFLQMMNMFLPLLIPLPYVTGWQMQWRCILQTSPSVWFCPMVVMVFAALKVKRSSLVLSQISFLVWTNSWCGGWIGRQHLPRILESAKVKPQQGRCWLLCRAYLALGSQRLRRFCDVSCILSVLWFPWTDFMCHSRDWGQGQTRMMQFIAEGPRILSSLEDSMRSCSKWWRVRSPKYGSRILTMCPGTNTFEDFEICGSNIWFEICATKFSDGCHVTGAGRSSWRRLVFWATSPSDCSGWGAVPLTAARRASRPQNPIDPMQQDTLKFHHFWAFWALAFPFSAEVEVPFGSFWLQDLFRCRLWGSRFA